MQVVKFNKLYNHSKISNNIIKFHQVFKLSNIYMILVMILITWLSLPMSRNLI